MRSTSGGISARVARGEGGVDGENGLADRDLRIALERTATGEHLVQHRAEGEDVASAIHRPAFGLLGRHVGGRAENRSPLGPQICRNRRRRVVPGLRLDQLGQAEVHELRLAALREHDVRRLDVAVDDAGGVRGAERARDLDGVVERLRDRKQLLLQEPVEGGAVDVLHDDEVAIGSFGGVPVDVVDRDDVGVVEGRGGPRLAGEAFPPPAAGGGVGVHDLDGHGAIEARVAGAIDDSHPSFAQLLEDLVVGDVPADHAEPSGVRVVRRIRVAAF